MPVSHILDSELCALSCFVWAWLCSVSGLWTREEQRLPSSMTDKSQFKALITEFLQSNILRTHRQSDAAEILATLRSN